MWGKLPRRASSTPYGMSSHTFKTAPQFECHRFLNVHCIINTTSLQLARLYVFIESKLWDHCKRDSFIKSAVLELFTVHISITFGILLVISFYLTNVISLRVLDVHLTYVPLRLCIVINTTHMDNLATYERLSDILYSWCNSAQFYPFLFRKFPLGL